MNFFKSYSFLSVFLTALFLEYSGVLKNTKKHPNAGLTLPELVEKYNYTLEQHEVVTEDGYILSLHRIPYKNTYEDEKRIPVLLMPGIINSAADYVILGPKRSLAFMLVDSGYDVWLANPRGTTYSRQHVVLDADVDNEFWDFGVDEIAQRDGPAIIDYILSQTEKEKLHYVGFSQGTTVLFSMLSEKPEYNSKIRLGSVIAPAAFLGNTISPPSLLVAYFRHVWEFAWDILGVNELMPPNGIFSQLMKTVCDKNSIFSPLCITATFAITGVGYDQFNWESLSAIYTNFPAGGSVRQIHFYLQAVKTGEFAKYDFGPEENLIRYGQEYPPAYNLSEVTIPIASYYSRNDWLVTKKDVDKLVNSISNPVRVYEVPHHSFNHVDFLYGKDAAELLYESLINEMGNY